MKADTVRGGKTVQKGPGPQCVQSHLPGQIKHGLNHRVSFKPEVVVIRTSHPKGLGTEHESRSLGAHE